MTWSVLQLSVVLSRPQSSSRELLARGLSHGGFHDDDYDGYGYDRPIGTLEEPVRMGMKA